jgi:hypothetical protein
VEIGVKVNVAPAIGESVNNGKASRSNASRRSEIIAQMSFGSAFYSITSSARPKLGIVIPAALKAAAMIGPGATCGGVSGERDGEHLSLEPPHIFDIDGVPLTRA